VFNTAQHTSATRRQNHVRSLLRRRAWMQYTVMQTSTKKPHAPNTNQYHGMAAEETTSTSTSTPATRNNPTQNVSWCVWFRRRSATVRESYEYVQVGWDTLGATLQAAPEYESEHVQFPAMVSGRALQTPRPLHTAPVDELKPGHVVQTFQSPATAFSIDSHVSPRAQSVLSLQNVRLVERDCSGGVHVLLPKSFRKDVVYAVHAGFWAGGDSTQYDTCK